MGPLPSEEFGRKEGKTSSHFIAHGTGPGERGRKRYHLITKCIQEIKTTGQLFLSFIIKNMFAIVNNGKELKKGHCSVL